MKDQTLLAAHACNTGFCAAAQAAMALIGLALFSGQHFKMKGGKGKFRSWAATEAAKLRALAAHTVRLNHRTASARHPKMQILKKILVLANAAGLKRLLLFLIMCFHFKILALLHSGSSSTWRS